MQDIIARALALRNNSSSDLNSAVKAIQPLSEIVSYGAEYTYKSEDYGKFETVKVTADTKSDDIIFVTKEGTNFITFQFWDANGKQSVYGGACNGRNLVMVSNTDSQINVFISAFGLKAFRYNADGTFKNLYNGTFVQNDTVLAKYNTTEYTPTADYHPATKKYVDDAIPTSLKNPHPLIFTGATSATYDGSESVTVDLSEGGGGGTDNFRLLQKIEIAADNNVKTFIVSTDDGGNEFSCQKIIVYGLTSCAESKKQNVTFYINGKQTIGSLPIVKNVNYWGYFATYFFITNGKLDAVCRFSDRTRQAHVIADEQGYYNTAQSDWVFASNLPIWDVTSINQIKIDCAVTLAESSEIWIYGA